MGQTPTLHEITRLGQEALLPSTAQSNLDVCDHEAGIRLSWNRLRSSGAL